MALDSTDGKTMLQILTSRYDDWKWRKKIEKTLSFAPHGVGDDRQRAVFLYLRNGLKAYKSRRSDPDSWMIGGYVTKEVIERAKFNPQVVGPDIDKEDVVFLGEDPGVQVDEAWWEDMLVQWFDVPEEELPPEQSDENSQADSSDLATDTEEKKSDES